MGSFPETLIDPRSVHYHFKEFLFFIDELDSFPRAVNFFVQTANIFNLKSVKCLWHYLHDDSRKKICKTRRGTRARCLWKILRHFSEKC